MADKSICQQISCGAITQAQAGIPLLLDCAESGYTGVLPCSSDTCRPWLNAIETNMGGPCPGLNPAAEPPSNAPNPLPEYVIMHKTSTNPKVLGPTITATSLLAPLPSITQPHVVPVFGAPDTGANNGDGGVNATWCDINAYIADYPIVAAAIVAGVYIAFNGKGK